MSSNVNTYQPQFFYISAISQGQTTTVTFTVNHDYVLGQWISFRVSKPYGMVELNNQKAQVIALTSNTVTVPIDSTNYTAFVVPAETKSTFAFPALAVPAGSGINPLQIPVGTILNDAFDNVPTT